jgi:hypothetical protein
MGRLLLAIAIFGMATATAAVPGPGCAPILSAMAKTLQVDHATVTQSNGQTTHGMTAGGVNYLQIDNAWKVGPFSAKDNQIRSDENLRNAQSYTCQSMPDTKVDGVAVANYRTRTESDGTVVESKISISKASGLAIQVENDLASGDSIKSHYVTHYSYTEILSPPIHKK